MSSLARRAGAALAAVPLLLVLTAGCAEEPEAERPTDAEETERAERPEGQIVLFYPASDDLLHPETRRLRLSGDVESRARRVVEAFLAGPRSERLVPLLPPETETEISYGADRILFVDLLHPELESPPASGSTGELLRVYALVNTVLANVEEPRAVVLLWNGQQRVTFSGHVDTTRPLRPRRTLISGARD